jgi:N-acetylglucosaminyldiphosphoundecaprenol N-acetyl-beta-D-mannosaminyltransferase
VNTIAANQDVTATTTAASATVEELATPGLEQTLFTDVPMRPAHVPQPHADDLRAIYLRGIRIHAVTEAQSVRYVLDSLADGRGGWVVTPNLDHLRRLSTDRKLRALYSHATLVVPDGMPLIWAARLQGTPLPERVAGSSLITSLSDGAAREGRSIFLLGGDPGTADGAAKVLRGNFPGITIAGTHCPPLGFEQDQNRLNEVIDLLQKARPDIVYVALGSPKQEWLIGQLKGYLPRAWWLGIGISFSFVSGHVRRAPHWMQRAGLEWVHRLCQEPRRLAKRYLVQGLPFAGSLLTAAVMHRVQSMWKKETSAA